MDTKAGSTSEMRAVTLALSNRTPPPEFDEMGPSDQDAQQIISEYSDFTEHLPADINRSLNLIDALKLKSAQCKAEVDRILKIYIDPEKIAAQKLDPVKLRAEYTIAINDRVRYQEQAEAESFRMNENIARHKERLNIIQAKLKYSFDHFPTDEELAIEQADAAALQARNSKNAIRGDLPKANKKDRSNMFRPPRAPRIYVPGEINPPEFDESETDTGSSDSDSINEDDVPETQGKKFARKSGVKKLKIRSDVKAGVEKPARPPRPPGIMGTNVHSTVAGISTSNALALLVAPPPDAPAGSIHRPWLVLTDWELASLRKRMKKNAIWQPSDTMVARELQANGRGPAELRKARARAEAEGGKFEGVTGKEAPGMSDNATVQDNALTLAAMAKDDVPTSNRGMILNEAKKAKREQQQREAALLAEGTSTALRTGLASMSTLFAPTAPKNKEEKGPKTPKTPKTANRRPTQKRKRDSTAETETPKAEADGTTITTQNSKRLKTETPVPAPPSSSTTQGSGPKSKNQTSTLAATEVNPASVTLGTTTTTIPLRASSPRKSSTPILPPVRERKHAKRDDKGTASGSARLALTPVPMENLRQESMKVATPTPPPQVLPPRRPASRGSAAINDNVTSIGKDRARRASTAHNTPAPEAPPTRPASRRGKRSAPGPVGTGVEGSAAVKTKRDHAPRKKAGPKKQKEEGQGADEAMDDLIDDGGEPIDPAEEIYCSCHRVQFGVMICCDNDDVRYARSTYEVHLLT